MVQTLRHKRDTREETAVRNNPGSLYWSGLALTALSALLFFLPWASSLPEDSYSGLFLLHYLIAAIYFIVLLVMGQLRKGRGGLPCLFQFLIQFLISAYALNRELPVFKLSATWLGVLLVVVCIPYAFLPFISRLPRLLQFIPAAIIGLGLALWIYLSVYLIPIYPYSAMLFFALGISLHGFAPLLFLIFTLKWLTAVHPYRKLRLQGVGIGLGAAFLITLIFCLQWQRLNRITERQFQQTFIADNTDLPAWIKVSSTLPDTWLTEKFLKGELVYSMPHFNDALDFWHMPSRSFDEVRKHDPLVMIAALFCGKSSLSTDDRLKILESAYDARHKTQDRLWSGANLATRQVITNVGIWPDLRLGYTEKTVTVTNAGSAERWQRQGEAIYTFHLPEGGVVTALSLWIDGREEPGILNTKGKADSAYRTVVGVESRDPSVVQWQEGNTASIRVFPVVAGASRVFKIGITAPLTKDGDRLRYDPVYFEGPDADGARETVRVSLAGNTGDLTGLEGFDRDERNRYTDERSYQEDWHLSFKDPGLRPNAFYFDHHAYTIRPYQQQRMPVNIGRVYLDINSAWTREEFETVYELVKDRKVYVANEEIVRLDETNKDKLFTALHRRHFSLFPIFSIKAPESALLISKGTRTSPGISDLKESAFGARLEERLKNSAKTRLFVLGDQLSPYLKALKEHRAFDFEQGDTALLSRLIRESIFAINPENDQQVVIDNAGMLLTKTDAGPAVSSAPDHLMRLFAYNHLMHRLQHGLYTNQEDNQELVAEAAAAHVVSPLSSLVVLESARDYDRFNIHAQANSLGNASLKSRGAVPEPHEWALLLIAFGVLTRLMLKKRQNQHTETL